MVNSEFEPGKETALHAFNGEAADYYRGISDKVAAEYARHYARMVGSRALGLEFSLPRIPHGLREPDRNLIRSALDTIARKHFSGD